MSIDFSRYLYIAHNPDDIEWKNGYSKPAYFGPIGVRLFTSNPLSFLLSLQRNSEYCPRKQHLTLGYREDRDTCQVVLNFQLQPQGVLCKMLVGANNDTVKNVLPHWKGYSLTGIGFQ